MLMNGPSKPHGRGRPAHSAQHMAARRKQIADHALELFQANGYGAVSMRRIADAAGCTVMTLYRYYDRKIDILRDLWARVFASLFDELDRIAAACPDPAERINAVALGYVRFWLTNRDQYFMVFMSSNVDQADVSIFVQDDALLARFQLFQRCLIEAMRADTPAEADVAVKSELLLCILNGIAHNLITISAYPWPSPDMLVQHAIRGLLRG
jgi:AcrR family transcriptional regulator